MSNGNEKEMRNEKQLCWEKGMDLSIQAGARSSTLPFTSTQTIERQEMGLQDVTLTETSLQND